MQCLEAQCRNGTFLQVRPSRDAKLNKLRGVANLHFHNQKDNLSSDFKKLIGQQNVRRA